MYTVIMSCVDCNLRVTMEITSGKLIGESREILLEYLFHCLIKKLLNTYLTAWLNN